MGRPSHRATVRAVLAGLAAAAVAAPAAAQSTRPLLDSPSLGLALPAASGATTDDTTALLVNPAGLGFLRGAELQVFAEAPGEDGGREGGALFLGTPLGPFSFALSSEWLEPPDPAPGLASLARSRRFSWGLAVGDDAFAFGAAFHHHASPDPVRAELFTWDLGVISRPSRWLSLGVAVRDLNAPEFGGVGLPRRWLASAGLRPLGDWLTVAAELDIPSGGDGPDGFEEAILGYVARVRPIPGLTLLGSFTHDPGTDRRAGTAGLQVDLEHLEAVGAALLRSGGDPAILAGARATTADLGGFDLDPRADVAVVDLGDALTRPSGLTLFPEERRLPVLDLVAWLDGVARGGPIDGVILKIAGNLPEVGFGEAAELRRAILRVRAAGKPVLVHLAGGDDVEYYVASAADRIVADPEAALLVNGLVARASFYADTLAKIGVSFEAVRVGTYKNAPEALVRSSPTEAFREVLDSILDDTFPRYVTETAAARKLTPERFREALAVGILAVPDAIRLGLVDGTAYPTDLDEEIGALLGRRARTFGVAPRPPGWQGWGAARTIAVIPVEGTIAMGDSGGGPFGLMEIAGAGTIVRAIEAAAADPQVAAIVVHVDSGGGSSQASDRIWRALVAAREKKPVVASMGDAAASGGYYVAAGAERIYANPSTLTGSIGIFVLKPSILGLVDLLDVGVYRTLRGERADLFNLYQPWTPEERAAMQAFLDDSYRRFLEAVAEGRDLTVEAVDRVAQGRVWTGAQALERGLVDDLSGLAGALAWARERAGLDPDDPVELRVLAPSTGLVSIEVAALAGPGAKGATLPAPLRELLRDGVPPALLVPDPVGAWALPEVQVQVR